MEIKNIPLICPNFNQVTYLKNLILWWKWYYPENPVFIIDNNSTSQSVKDYYYKLVDEHLDIEVTDYNTNECPLNLADYLADIFPKYPCEYYVISDPDIMPHPATPPYFLEVFKELIDKHGFHHAGFGLNWEDIPDWNHEKKFIQDNERQFSTPQNGAPSTHILNKNSSEPIPVSRFDGGLDTCKSMCLRNPETYVLVNEKESNIFNFKFEGEMLSGFRAPIDTTFALYTTKNSGWSSPMPGDDWSNSIRIFKSWHLPWYQNPEYVNDEMKHYYKTARYWEAGVASAGVNHNRPKEYQ